jgi:hypothetical protein
MQGEANAQKRTSWKIDLHLRDHKDTDDSGGVNYADGPVEAPAVAEEDEWGGYKGLWFQGIQLSQEGFSSTVGPSTLALAPGNPIKLKITGHTYSVNTNSLFAL